MRIGIHSQDGCGLVFWARLQDEGHEILVYTPDIDKKDVGKDLVPKAASYGAFVAWLKAKPSIAFFDSSRAGKQADQLRAMGIPTIGGGALCDRLEEDRAFGIGIAKDIGCAIPPYKEFATVGAAIAYVNANPGKEQYFKSDRYLDSDATFGGKAGDLVRYLSALRDRYGDRIPNILQEKIDGVAVSTGAWWNGSAFVPPFEGTIEHKKFGTGEVGPSTGCAINVLWYYDDDVPEIARRLGFEKLATILRAKQAPPALYDINSVVDAHGTPWFLEWTVRMGYDSEPTSQRLIYPEEGFGSMLVGLATGRLDELPVALDEIAYGVRLSVPPYPWEHVNRTDKHSSYGTAVHGPKNLWGEDGFCGYALMQGKYGLEVADGSGLVGVAVGTGARLSAVHEQVVDYCKAGVHAAGLSYRIDGDKVLGADAKKIVAAGLSLPKGVTA